MIVERLSPQKVEVHFTGITLLSKDEYESNFDIIEPLDHWWWLRSPGYFKETAEYVARDGSVKYRYVNFISQDVRHVLIGNFKSSGLLRGDKFELANFMWTVLTDDIALCDKSVGSTYFRMKYYVNNANDFDASDIKEWLYDWADKNNIYFIMQTFSPD